MKKRAPAVVVIRSFGVAAVLVIAMVGCSSGAEDEPSSTAPAATQSEAEAGLTYIALGDSWPEGAHCDPACSTFPELHAEAIEEMTGEPIEFMNLSGQAQPFFDTPSGGGSAGLLKALQSDEDFRGKVAEGDVIVISTGPNDGGEVFEMIMAGTCGGKDDTACVGQLGRTWTREFDAILNEIEELRDGQPTVIRLVNAANAFIDPSNSPEIQRGIDAFFQALTDALCDNAEAHGVICIDVRPVLNGPEFEQPVNDSTQASMDAVAALLIAEGTPELTAS